MNVKSLVVLLLVLGLIAGSAFFIFDQVINKDAVTLGLDLEGGVYVLLQAQPTEDQPVTTRAIEESIARIRNRVDQLGTREPEIRREGNDRILVAIPGAEDQKAALDIIGQTALLEFKEIVEEGDEITLRTFMTGQHLEDAFVSFDEYGRPIIELRFSREGGQIMQQFTSANIGNLMIITLDDVTLSTAEVKDAISDRGVITGNFTDAHARTQALLLRSGALPLSFRTLEARTIGPKLGMDSLLDSLYAGRIGILLVLLFMALVYRTFGMVANVALVAYVTLVVGALIGINATLTLPGIAGLVLGIGMAVDANIIIFERIKEEIKNGRSLRSAIDAGFTRAIRTILDANITTLIAAAVLFQFGTGPVQGFAVTLAISIVCSMLTAVFVTRWILKLVFNSGLMKTERALGRM